MNLEVGSALSFIALLFYLGPYADQRIFCVSLVYGCRLLRRAGAPGRLACLHVCSVNFRVTWWSTKGDWRKIILNHKWSYDAVKNVRNLPTKLLVGRVHNEGKLLSTVLKQGSLSATSYRLNLIRCNMGSPRSSTQLAKINTDLEKQNPNTNAFEKCWNPCINMQTRLLWFFLCKTRLTPKKWKMYEVGPDMPERPDTTLPNCL